MSLCFLARVSSSIFKGSALGNLSNQLRKPVCSVYIFRQSYHQLVSDQNRGKEPLALCKYGWKSASVLDFAKQFSTSSSLLAQHKNHDHSKLWTVERVLSAILVPLVPAALIYPSQSLDTALALVIVIHTHFGLEAIVVDYIRPILFGQLAPKIGLGLLYIFSIVTLAGLLNLIYNDTGLANTLITIWKL